MRVVQVHFKVTPEGVEAFKKACAENARQSLQEEGVVRFDILQSDDDPTVFILFEVYHSAAAQLAHKETPHFFKWRSEVKDLIVQPGEAKIYSNISPGEDC